MMQIAQQEFMSEAQQLERRRVVRSKLFSPVRAKPATAPAKVYVIPPTARPMWKRFNLSFSEHIRAWESALASSGASPALAYLRQRCVDVGFTYEQITKQGRNYKLVAIRHQLMWEVHERFQLSFPQVGRIFKRDHTSIIHACQKIEAERGRG